MKYKFLNRTILRAVSPKFYKALKTANINELNSFDNKYDAQKKLSNLLKHAYTNVPYYKEILNDYFLEKKSFNEIPHLTKSIIKNNFNKLKAANLPKNRFKNNSTSGSTGEAMFFYSDNNTDFFRHAVAYRADAWTGWVFGEPRVKIWGALSDLSKEKSLKKKLVNSSLLFNSTLLSSYDMKDNDMIKYIDFINKNKPSLIVGYPSSLDLFAKFVQNYNANIWRPKGIITSGETLYDFQRKSIEKTFNTKVLNRYGCRDVGLIASECEKQNGLHISSDHVLVEVVDEYGESCKPGELGEILVTDLDNYVFPFIRYKIGDLGVLSDRTCSCGRAFPLLERVEGRTFDLIIGSNGNRVPGNFFTLLRNKIKGINKFQLYQRNIGEIKLLLETNKLFDESQKVLLISKLKEKLGIDTKINIEIVDSIPVTSSGKHRWIISEVSPFN